MLKRVLLLLCILGLTIYLGVAVTAFNRRPQPQTCRELSLIIKDSVYAGFITQQEVKELLTSKRAYPVGKPLQEVSCKALEKILNQHPLIDHTECYPTLSGAVNVEIVQRIPLLRVMNNQGENYYIDTKGKVMPAHTRAAAHRVIATGRIEKSFAMKELYKFGVFLQENKFWDAQIEQIHVTPQQEIELVPRVGDHLIFLGKMDNFEQKLARLQTFYEKGLSKVGWNKYARISVEFHNQIICTKRESPSAN